MDVTKFKEFDQGPLEKVFADLDDAEDWAQLGANWKGRPFYLYNHGEDSYIVQSFLRQEGAYFAPIAIQPIATFNPEQDNGDSADAGEYAGEQRNGEGD